MKKLVLLAFLGLNAVTVFAQRDMDVYESDRRYCASGRSGVDFNSCMWRLQNDRSGRHERREYDRRYGWGEAPQRYVPVPVPVPAPQWQPDPYGPRWEAPQQREGPRLSDMQKLALQNCNVLHPRDQPGCRAAVWSTVGR
ncbi:hypothetical protein [Variovorax sp. GB1P17]|uniref:hypothetical protein n=1 Tax=Variovorax sp. GB1P17 TaxID=3443740 RepID=UPI003F461AF1